MSIIYGCGLPRTGTTSLAKALEILGYDVVHYCPITHSNTQQEFQEIHQVYVSSNLLNDFRPWEGKWIVLYPRKDWLEYMLLVYGKYAHTLFLTYRDGWYNIKEYKAPNILHYVITEGWEPLCRFLGHNIPKEPFPHLNASS